MSIQGHFAHQFSTAEAAQKPHLAFKEEAYPSLPTRAPVIHFTRITNTALQRLQARYSRVRAFVKQPEIAQFIQETGFPRSGLTWGAQRFEHGIAALANLEKQGVNALNQPDSSQIRAAFDTLVQAGTALDAVRADLESRSGILVQPEPEGTNPLLAYFSTLDEIRAALPINARIERKNKEVQHLL